MTKKQVFIRTNILNISKISTLEETIDAHIELVSKWKIPKKEQYNVKKCDNLSIGSWDSDHSSSPRPLYNYDETNYKKIKKHVWAEDIWNPKLFIQNLIKCFDINVSYKIVREKDELFIEEKQQIQGKFIEKMELRSFPFDKQKFQFIVQSKIEDDKIELIFESNSRGLTILNNSITEWNLCPYFYHLNSHQGNFPNILLSLEGVRIYKYYIWNLLLINSLIQLISLSSISINYKLPEERLNIGVVLLLTNIAFKLSNNMNLPNTSYLTYIDKYQLSAFLFHTLVIIQNVVSSFITNIETFDFWSYMILIGIYIINHSLFIINGYRLVKSH
jgi:hypothetical protein